MKITEKELRKIVKEAVQKKLSMINEGNDFTAKRQIVLAAGNTSMSFETEIVKLLDLVAPDDLPDEAQKMYYQVVEDMKSKFVEAVTEAVNKLSKFPRNAGRSEGGE